MIAQLKPIFYEPFGIKWPANQLMLQSPTKLYIICRYEKPYYPKKVKYTIKKYFKKKPQTYGTYERFLYLCTEAKLKHCIL